MIGFRKALLAPLALACLILCAWPGMSRAQQVQGYPLCPSQIGLTPTQATHLTMPTGVPSGSTCTTQPGIIPVFASICAYTAVVYYDWGGIPTSASNQIQPGSCLPIYLNIIQAIQIYSPSGTANVYYAR